MKRKSWKLGSLGLAAMLLLGACSSGSAEESKGKEYKLKMSVTVNDSSTWYAAAKKLSDDVSEETDGRIKIEVFPNEQLSGGDSGKAVEMLSKGSTDLTFNSTIIYSILDERFGVASAPFLFNNTDEVDKVFGGEGGEAITKILEEKGVKALGFGQNGFRQVTNSVKEIKSPEDLKGLKIRIPGITMYTDLYRTLGADPTTMTFSEVFTSLQQGTINGQENPIDVIHSSKLNEVQDYLTLWNYSYDPLVLGMNKKLYDSMSKEDQELFARLGKEAAEYQVELAREKETKQLEELKAAGMKLYEPTEDELAKFKEVVQPVYDKYTSIWGEDLLKAFQKR
ncbi:DctP family TRAP transporter solute-binding subunit [Psychrobacillus vulpis]|uniref:DctP family TRAP transporter solute-binding subunit n=1 Tax=Psychrobacillus vulpis TaxID=2325572 RepID=A0A544TV74_9BACI|nr:DctP family TRAP transporter solute-binding subunit [Psychrobacillus vulpis]TQR21340.1 DctP family TRAP transporter solute-binding subunit [Psychrobacillus vulpis]